MRSAQMSSWSSVAALRCAVVCSSITRKRVAGSLFSPRAIDLRMRSPLWPKEFRFRALAPVYQVAADKLVQQTCRKCLIRDTFFHRARLQRF